MEVKINKEIRNYTESMFFGLSLRQFIFSLLACGHTVVFDKAHYRKGSSTENTHPTEGFCPEVWAENKIQSYRHTAGK